MEKRSSLLLAIGIAAQLLICSLAPTESQDIPAPPLLTFDSSYFPEDFVWGVASSAYQTEGAANKSGRGPSTWDEYTHEYPERIDDRSNGDVAVDYYTYYKGNIKRMSKQLRMTAFRFSISWTRIIPSGRRREGINEEGINFYNRVINETLKNGLVPYVTLFHWDVPQAVEDKYGGFRSPNIVADFRDYVELCFQRFGDRVKHWITINEPYVFTIHGYEVGKSALAPGRCSSWVYRACPAGDSGTEPYIVGHHVLLAHAAAVQVFRAMGLDGKIGLILDVTWPQPYDFNNPADRAAAQRNLDFSFGWFMDPLVYGHYPRIMQEMVTGGRLPTFTKEQIASLKGSYDFVGLNYYTGNFASANITVDPDPTHIRYATDSRVNLTKTRHDGVHIGIPASPSWLYIFPEGLRYLLNYTKDTYRNPDIYVTENGVGDDKDLSPEDALKDTWRISYFKIHLWNVLRSICDHGVKVKGYFAWSFMDNFEWSNGYTIRMGLYGVDMNNNLARRKKLSVSWFNDFLKNKAVTGGPKCEIIERKDEHSPTDDFDEL